MTEQRKGTNYYEVLEVESTASQADIHRAYQKAKATYSQDNPALYSMFTPEEARELLRLIEEAYQTLSNIATRRAFDERFFGHSSIPTPSAAPSAAIPVTASIRPQPIASSVEAQHKALPELEPTLRAEPAAMTEVASGRFPDGTEFTVRKREQTKPSLPVGTGRTAFSTYQIDDALEAEIASRSEFDGAFLAQVRNYKNISLDKMSEATRISRTYISAVEANDYKNLPAAVFVRGFVVQLARALGLDDQKVASAYMRQFKAGGGK